MNPFSSSAPIGGGVRGVLRLSDFAPRHPNDEAASAFIGTAASVFSRSEMMAAVKAFNLHWVESVGDLRLLLHEELLGTIGLPPRMGGVDRGGAVHHRREGGSCCDGRSVRLQLHLPACH